MVNQATIIGNLGKPPELRYTANGSAVVSFPVATTEKYNGETHTTWHNVVAWKQLAEICSKYLNKGSKVYIQGKIQHRSYDDKDGNKKYITEVVARDMKMLDSRPQESTAQTPGRVMNEPASGINEPPLFNPDDDIPFAYPHFQRELK